MSKGLIAGIIASFQITLLFVICLMIYGALSDSPLADNPQAKAALEIGQQTTVHVFNWWMLADDIAGIITFIGVIFGLIYLVIKIAKKETDSGGFYG